MPRPAPLELRDVRVRHEGATRFTPDGITLTVHPGEVVLVLGPSGSGKSSLAMALNGLIPHSVPATLEGTVRVSGVDTATGTVPTLSTNVAMVFQDPDAQMVTATVLDEVCFGPENLGRDVEDILRSAHDALRIVGLWERRDDSPDVLSGGGRQRLAIACALAMDAPVLVLDEPTANLDPIGIREVYRALAAIVERGDRSIVLIEHNLDAAMDLVDRVLVLDRAGRQVFLGDARTVLTDHTEELAALGVWLPVATLAGLQLRGAGIDLRPIPLTPPELTAALDALETLPEPNRIVTRERGFLEGPMIRVSHLSLSRGRGRRAARVLHDVSFELDAGSFLGVVGTNGAGKTSLAQAIAGVIRPPRGAVSLSGLDPARIDVATLTSRIGFVFQNPEHQFVTYTVADELAHGLRLRGMDEEIIAQRVNTMLERFGLTDLRDQHPFLLSGGQKRRLSVGTAMIAGAGILVLDEPTFGQDQSRAAEVLSILRDLNEAGNTVVIVSHDLQLVADYASHVAVMQDGHLVGFGPSDEILSDSTLIDAAGLWQPPLAHAMRALTRHPSWREITRIDELPGATS